MYTTSKNNVQDAVQEEYIIYNDIIQISIKINVLNAIQGRVYHLYDKIIHK